MGWLKDSNTHLNACETTEAGAGSESDLTVLLSCPFCGCDAEHRGDGDDSETPYWVQCTMCDAAMENFPSPDFAAYSWNKRAT